MIKPYINSIINENFLANFSFYNMSTIRSIILARNHSLLVIIVEEL